MFGPEHVVLRPGWARKTPRRAELVAGIPYGLAARSHFQTCSHKVALAEESKEELQAWPHRFEGVKAADEKACECNIPLPHSGNYISGQIC